jgi:hypothetical protein
MTVLTIEQPAIPAGWRWVLREYKDSWFNPYGVLLQKPVEVPCGFLKRKTKPMWETVGQGTVLAVDKLNPLAHNKAAQQAWDSYQKEEANKVRKATDVKYVWPTML